MKSYVEHHLPADILKTGYYSLFDTHLHYACQVWGHGNSDILVIAQRTQTKALRMINSKKKRRPWEPLFIQQRY